ncbi:unnamed protein product [Heterosigma akashiwo]
MKLMFQSADGNMQELDDQQLQELEGKRIVFQDGAGNLQQLSAAAPSPRGSSSAATFLTSPLAVVVLAGLALLGAVLAAQRGPPGGPPSPATTTGPPSWGRRGRPRIRARGRGQRG